MSQWWGHGGRQRERGTSLRSGELWGRGENIQVTLSVIALAFLGRQPEVNPLVLYSL